MSKSPEIKNIQTGLRWACAIHVLVRFLSAVVRFYFQVFLWGNFHPLEYFCGVMQFIFLGQQTVLSAKHVPKDFCIFISATTSTVVVRTLQTKFDVQMTT